MPQSESEVHAKVVVVVPMVVVVITLVVGVVVVTISVVVISMVVVVGHSSGLVTKVPSGHMYFTSPPRNPKT